MAIIFCFTGILLHSYHGSQTTHWYRKNALSNVRGRKFTYEENYDQDRLLNPSYFSKKKKKAFLLIFAKIAGIQLPVLIIIFSIGLFSSPNVRKDIFSIPVSGLRPMVRV